MSDVYFSKDRIEITQSMARFGNTTYPIANIGAVSLEKHPNKNKGFAVFATLAGAFWALSSKGSIIAIVLFIFGIALWIYANRNFGLKLMLRTSSGNEQAFESEDRKLVEELKNAIESAIRSRG